MRWDNLRLATVEPSGGTSAEGAISSRAAAGEPAADAASAVPLPLPLAGRGATVRTFDTPEFRGVTCYEVRAKSILNRVPGPSRMPFRWTLNPYRGCTHACTYCFARNTHTYLDLDSGHDFDSRIVVKVNAPDLLRKELGAKSWQGESIAMGTNVDPYQRAEGRYRLMRGILTTLRDYANPFSILTKGTLILRDLDLLTDSAQVTDVRVSVSVGFVDHLLWRQVEPGAPSPRARLGVCRSLVDAGVGCGVLMAPVLPFLTDSDEQLEATVAAIADAGADSVTPLVLHLRPGAREWFLGWLSGARPDLVGRYLRLYSRGAYVPDEYSAAVTARVAELAARYGIGAAAPWSSRRYGGEPVAPEPRQVPNTQLSLL
jgi:DNA repair photolyase